MIGTRPIVRIECDCGKYDDVPAKERGVPTHQPANYQLFMTGFRVVFEPELPPGWTSEEIKPTYRANYVCDNCNYLTKWRKEQNENR